MLDRFVKAQMGTYQMALREIKQGRKQNHWIWFVFPQLRGLGLSSKSDYYGIEGLEEAQLYLKHPILREHLLEISNEVLKLESDNIYSVMAGDAKKLCSSMTLFMLADPSIKVFSAVIDKYFKGKEDSLTVSMLKSLEL
jgi:uncharacterized protein (DUF1810 family)